MLPLLVLVPKFLLLSGLKYVPLPVFQTLVEHEVEVPVIGPDGTTTTRKVKLLPSRADLRNDWRRALKDSGLAFWHPHLAMRFFTNVCETMVIVLLVPRTIYGWIRRRRSFAYRTLSVPHTAEPEQFKAIVCLSRKEILKRSCSWIWSSIKVWNADWYSDPPVIIRPMGKNPDWRILICRGRAFAFRLVPRSGVSWDSATFKLPGNASLTITRYNELTAQICTSGDDQITISLETLIDENQGENK